MRYPWATRISLSLNIFYLSYACHIFWKRGAFEEITTVVKHHFIIMAHYTYRFCCRSSCKCWSTSFFSSYPWHSKAIRLRGNFIREDAHRWRNVQWVPQLFEQQEFFHVYKSCKIECCGNKMHQIVQNMILTWGLELKLSLLWRATLSG